MLVRAKALQGKNIKNILKHNIGYRNISTEVAGLGRLSAYYY